MAEQFQSENLIFASSLLSLSRTVSLVTEKRFLLRAMDSIFRSVASALQCYRPKGMVGMGIRGVMVVMAVI